MADVKNKIEAAVAAVDFSGIRGHADVPRRRGWEVLDRVVATGGALMSFGWGDLMSLLGGEDGVGGRNVVVVKKLD